MADSVRVQFRASIGALSLRRAPRSRYLAFRLLRHDVLLSALTPGLSDLHGGSLGWTAKKAVG